MGLFKPKLRDDIQQKIDELKPEVFISVPLAGGLPLPEGTLCQIYYCKDKIAICDINTTFVISLDKVQDISKKTDIEIQKQTVSSAGGAVAGGIMFGAIGALVGGRVKTKTTKEVTTYLIITYESESSEIKYLAFKATYTPKSNEIIKLFEQREKSNKIVQL